MSRWSPAIREYEAERQANLKSVPRKGINPEEDPHPLAPEKTIVKSVSLLSHSNRNLVDSAAVSPPLAKSSPTPTKSGGFVDPLGGGADPLGAADPLRSGGGDPLRGGDPLGGSTPTSSRRFDPLSDPLSSSAGAASGSPGLSHTSSSSSKLSASGSVNDLLTKSPSSTHIGSNNTGSSNNISTAADDDSDSFVPWASKKSAILQEFTTNEMVAVTVSFIDASESGKVRVPQDKKQQRLAELQQDEDQTKQLQMSQKDYEKHIEKLHDDLIAAWNAEERVKSLKIAIQCAKLLNDTSVIKFYPSKFVLITEILDTFGRLVFDRIGKRDDGKDNKTADAVSKSASQQQLVKPGSAGSKKKPMREVSDQARETCRNWFYKIASIRELLPRLYVEMAILKCYEFIQENTFPTVIARISQMIRGVGDPLVAAYVRAYLARKGHEVAPGLKDYLLTNFLDSIESQKVLKTTAFQDNLKNLHVSLPDYLHLYSPALDWSLQCLGHRASQVTFNQVLEKYRESTNPIVLNHIISSFQPDLISSNALLLTNLIKEADDTFPKYQLFTSLGVNLVLSAPAVDQQLTILNEAWKVVTNLTVPKEYISAADIYIEYPIKYGTPKEVNVMLGDILKHVKENNAYEQLQAQMHSIVQKILAHYHDFVVIFGMDNFSLLIDLFSGPTQVEVYSTILSSFARHQEQPTGDPVIVATMTSIAKAVHDTINTLSFRDTIRQISRDISAFIHKIDFGMDFEKHLAFFVECRRAFANLDQVKTQLVIGTCSLAMRTLRVVKGKHTAKTAAFVRACVAYCYITIPSMADYLQQLHLYLLSGQVALMNKALAQADSLFKAAVKTVAEVPPRVELEGNQTRSTQDAVVSFVQEFFSSLLVIPGHPDQGPFYLVKGLLKVLSEYPWERPATKTRLYIHLLALLASLAQPKFAYRMLNVDSNDAMYSSEEDYKTELNAIIAKVVEEILEDISKMDVSTSENQRAQSQLALEMFNYTVAFSELTSKSATLCVNLFNVARKDVEPAALRSALTFLRSRERLYPLAGELHKKLTQ